MSVVKIGRPRENPDRLLLLQTLRVACNRARQALVDVTEDDPEFEMRFDLARDDRLSLADLHNGLLEVAEAARKRERRPW